MLFLAFPFAVKLVDKRNASGARRNWADTVDNPAAAIIWGSEWGGPLVGCRLKFSNFVGSRLKFSIFVGSRLNVSIIVGRRKILVN